jgi:enhancing lycopene biosynthesis protein 2
MAKTVGVVLSGCGYLDGTEIHEATLTLLAIDQAGARVQCFAPNQDQLHVIDHKTGQPVAGAHRHVIQESARIARGDVADLALAKATDLDAVIFPGGYGAAKNLCSFATDGIGMRVHPQVDRLIKEVRLAGKPLGFICIAPAIAAKVLGELHPKLTIGNDKATADALNRMGAQHVACTVDDTVVDEPHKIVSTPAYMLGPSIAHINRGISKLVSQILGMIG